MVTLPIQKFTFKLFSDMLAAIQISACAEVAIKTESILTTSTDHSNWLFVNIKWTMFLWIYIYHFISSIWRMKRCTPRNYLRFDGSSIYYVNHWLHNVWRDEGAQYKWLWRSWWDYQGPQCNGQHSGVRFCLRISLVRVFFTIV